MRSRATSPLQGEAGPRRRFAIVGIAHPMRGGIAQYTAILARELSRRHEVKLVSYTRQYPSLLFPGKSQLDTSESPVRYPATPLVDSIGPWSWERAARHIASFDPDALVYKYWMPFFAPSLGTIAGRVKRLAGRGRPRTIMVVDNLIPHERRPGDLMLTRWLMRRTDAYIVQSAAVGKDLLALDPSARFLEVPHPLYNVFGERLPKEEARRRLGLAPDRPVLLFFGFVRAYKGLDLLIRALPQVRRRIDATLLVAGEFYEGREDTVRLVASLGLSEVVQLRDDYLPDERVAEVFSAADVVVLPYRSATQSGIVQIAYQLERPVICTGVGGLTEVVLDGRTGLVVPPGEPDALASAIVRYYEEQLEEPFTQGVRAEKAKYGWDPMVRAIEELSAPA